MTALSGNGKGAGDSIVDNAAETEQICLDLSGDMPLKIYEVRSGEIKNLTGPSWTPQLHPTTRKHKVVKTSDTVLLLGCMETGKTCVICNVFW
jgi:hypothetical protein